MVSPRRLYRSANNRILGGVCAGIADYLNTDPTIIRLIWVVLSIWPFHILGGILLYLVAWALIPEK